jgi:hypothetical protein
MLRIGGNRRRYVCKEIIRVAVARDVIDQAIAKASLALMRRTLNSSDFVLPGPTARTRRLSR